MKLSKKKLEAIRKLLEYDDRVGSIDIKHKLVIRHGGYWIVPFVRRGVLKQHRVAIVCDDNKKLFYIANIERLW